MSTPSSPANPPTPNASGPLPGGTYLVPLLDALTLLPVSERTLRALVASQSVGHSRIGGRIFMAWPQDFDDFLDVIRIDPENKDDAA